MRKFLVALGLLALGGLAMYLMDPDRGRSRRARIADQAEATSKDIKDMAESVSAAAHHQADVVKGVAHDVADAFTDNDAGAAKKSGGAK
jgi:hypothetical protein